MTGLLAVLCAFAAHAESASFPSLDGTPIKAQVFQPAQQPARGAVVALHGCGGLYATSGARTGQLSARHQAMADMLTAEGYVAIFPDSLTPRGEREICTQRAGTRRVGLAERRADALAALAWVGAQSWAQPTRIALLGWSNGGSTLLAAIDGGRSDVQAQPVRPAIAIAFYPGCGTVMNARYKPHTRLVMLLGEKDDWTAPGPCVELGKRTGAEVIVYAGSYHGFDNPVGKVGLRTDVPNGVNPGQGVHVGANPGAREQANARVRELLREAFR